MTERTINAERMEDLIAVFGSFDENIKRIEEALGVKIVNRGSELKITGEEEAADKAVRTVDGLLSWRPVGSRSMNSGCAISSPWCRRTMTIWCRRWPRCGLHHRQRKAHQGKDGGPRDLYEGHPEQYHHLGRWWLGHRQDLPCRGGCGGSIPERTVNRIILTRPAVEAGERLGFLPGDLQNKVGSLPAPAV